MNLLELPSLGYNITAVFNQIEPVINYNTYNSLGHSQTLFFQLKIV